MGKLKYSNLEEQVESKVMVAEETHLGNYTRACAVLTKSKANYEAKIKMAKESLNCYSKKVAWYRERYSESVAERAKQEWVCKLAFLKTGLSAFKLDEDWKPCHDDLYKAVLKLVEQKEQR